MGEELLAHHRAVSAELDALRSLLPAVTADYRQRLMERVRQAIGDAGVAVQPDHLIREVALFADRTDVSEEVTRLSSAPGAVRGPGPQGRGGGPQAGVRPSGNGPRGEHARLEGRRRGDFAARLRDQGDAGKSPGTGTERGVVVGP